MEDRADRYVAGKNRSVKASSPHGAAACNETTTILDYPSGEGRHGRSICAGRTSGGRDCHSAVRMREVFFRTDRPISGLAPIGEPCEGREMGREKLERPREKEKEREAGKESTGRRPIDKQINREWKDDPQSYQSRAWTRLYPLLFSFPFSPLPRAHVSPAFTQTARPLAERGKSALPLSNLSCVRRSRPALRG